MMSATDDAKGPLYRVFVNDGHNGSKLIGGLAEVGSLAYHHLVTRKEYGVTLRIIPLQVDGRRLDGVGEGPEPAQ